MAHNPIALGLRSNIGRFEMKLSPSPSLQILFLKVITANKFVWLISKY